MEWKAAVQFREIGEAWWWCQRYTSGPCTVVVFSNPYEWDCGEQTLARQYPNEFYFNRR
jgi:hypothetical protein